MNKYKEDYPLAQISTRAYLGSSIHQKLLSDECNIGITSTIPTDDRIIYESFFNDPLVLIAPKTMKLKKPLPLNSLCKIPLVLREEGCNASRLLREALAKEGIRLSDCNIASCRLLDALSEEG